MVEMQREIANKTSCILDGRDIGSYVLPNADYKFFITASVEVRANRRFIELTQKGHNVDYNQLMAEIEQRDYNDRNRDFAPLVQAEDAVVIDTSDMDIETVCSTVLKHINK